MGLIVKWPFNIVMGIPSAGIQTSCWNGGVLPSLSTREEYCNKGTSCIFDGLVYFTPIRFLEDTLCYHNYAFRSIGPGFMASA